MEDINTYKHSDLTGKIIGSALEVHNFLGNGFQEVIYQRALSIELNRSNINHVRELTRKIFYKDVVEPLGRRRADFIVEEKVLIELKAVINLEPVHYAQVLNYLRAYRVEVGLLINFGAKSLQFKRFILTDRG